MNLEIQVSCPSWPKLLKNLLRSQPSNGCGYINILAFIGRTLGSAVITSSFIREIMDLKAAIIEQKDSPGFFTRSKVEWSLKRDFIINLKVRKLMIQVQCFLRSQNEPVYSTYST